VIRIDDHVGDGKSSPVHGLVEKRADVLTFLELALE
jgi:hypothetical protein